MKLKSVITHTFIFAAGSIITAGYFLFSFVPSTASYIGSDSKKIKMSNDSETVDYQPILEKDFLASLYLHEPLYFLWRDKGYKSLEELAKSGYSPATTTLFHYNMGRVTDIGSSDYPKSNIHYKEAYKLAMLAAEQGSYYPLLFMIKIYHLDVSEDITQEIELLENAALNSSKDNLAFGLHAYYLEKKDEEKAEHWLNIAQKIWDEKRPEPACTTITPWRGY